MRRNRYCFEYMEGGNVKCKFRTQTRHFIFVLVLFTFALLRGGLTPDKERRKREETALDRVS